jgi:two-component system, sensor histidine kinase and response regulator
MRAINRQNYNRAKAKMNFHNMETAAGLVVSAVMIVLLVLTWTAFSSAKKLKAVYASELEKAKAAIHQSEQKFFSVYENSPLSICLIKWPEVSYVDVNPAWTKLFGFSREEAIGKTSLQLGIQRNAKNHSDNVRQFQEKRAILSREAHAISRSGRDLVLITDTNKIELNGQMHLLATQVDVTESRKLERQLEATFNQAAIGIAHVSTDGKWLKVNHKLCEILGYTENEFLTKTFQEITHPEDLAKDLDFVRRMLAQEIKEYSFEKRYIKKDGSEIWINLSVALVWNSVHQPDYFISTVEDINEKKRAEREREELSVREQVAVQASRIKSEFLANMSHEIRTPINGVIGMTNILIDTSLDAIQTEYADTIRRSANILLNVVNDVLDFSKIEAGKMELEIVDFDLAELIQDTFKTLTFAAKRKNLDFQFPGVEPWPHLFKGDPVRFQQVLINLLGNSIKFTQETGRVSLHVQLTEETEAMARFRFEVRDNGIGVPLEALKKMFQPFSQADTSISRRFGGTGLGLSIAKRLVDMMGGEIGVESQLGNGSTFWVTLDLAKGPSVDLDKNSVLGSGSLSRNYGGEFRVLVAEDNQVNQLVAVKHLEKLGLKADVVVNGVEAVQALMDRA